MDADRRDFFISYNKDDESWATWIAYVLEEAGFHVFLQAWDFRPGANFVLEMDRASILSDRTLLVLSPSFLKSVYTQPEWAAAFGSDPDGALRRLFPVRVQPCKPEGLLGQVVYCNLVGLNEEQARDRLLADAGSKRAKPDLAPSFPGGAIEDTPPSFPGHLPSVWSVPSHRNLNFLGRDDLLLNIASRFDVESDLAIQLCLHGLGGIGKSSCAVEYAYRYRDRYDVVWWVSAESPGSLYSSYARLITYLEPNWLETQDQEAVSIAVKSWLHNNDRWLLVFDDADNFHAISEYLPQGGGGHVLVTSRNPNWLGRMPTIEVLSLERAASVDFLSQRTKSNDDGGANEVADLLGDLPLALEQAGSYVDSTGISLSRYASLFRDKRGELWKREEQPLDYHATVAITWQISMDGAKGIVSDADTLMSIIGMCSTDSIPIGLLRASMEALLDRAIDELAVLDAVAALRRFSLVRSMRGDVFVHKLVQLVALDDTSWEQQVASAMVKVLVSRFSPSTEDYSGHVAESALVTHALSVGYHAQRLSILNHSVSMLLMMAGRVLARNAEYVGARKAFNASLRVADGSSDIDLADRAAILNNLGMVLIELGSLDEAETVLAEALQLDKQVYDNNHPHVATTLNNLAIVIKGKGDLASARILLEEALAIDQEHFGSESWQVANRVNNLGSIVHDQGEIHSAMMMYETALAIDRRVHGSSHPSVATDLGNLAAIYQELYWLDDAESSIREAIEIDRAVFGEKHPKYAMRLSVLGHILDAKGDLSSALQCHRDALSIDEATFGSLHPRVAVRLSAVGGVLLQMGRTEEAAVALERALEIDRNALGTRHSTVAKRTANLAALRHAQGRWDEALALYTESIEVVRAVLGEDHQDYGNLIGNLAVVYRDIGDKQEAVKLYTIARMVLARSLGEDHPFVMNFDSEIAALNGNIE